MIGETQPLAPVLAPVVRRRRAQWLRALQRDRTTMLAGLLVVLIVAGSVIHGWRRESYPDSIGGAKDGSAKAPIETTIRSGSSGSV